MSSPSCVLSGACTSNEGLRDRLLSGAGTTWISSYSIHSGSEQRNERSSPGPHLRPRLRRVCSGLVLSRGRELRGCPPGLTRARILMQMACRLSPQGSRYREALVRSEIHTHNVIIVPQTLSSAFCCRIVHSEI